jgi:hypothetical protein
MKSLRSQSLFAIIILTAFLQSCGGLTTVISVYPDGSAQLAYEIETPMTKTPDMDRLADGEWAELFKKDRYLSQEPSKLMDSLTRNAVVPLLMRLQNRGQIRHFMVKDTNEIMTKKLTISIELKQYGDVGRIYSAFRREIPAIDSIFRKLAGKTPTEPMDSVAIVSLGDSLELQLHNFAKLHEPFGTREERIAKTRHMLDSVLLVMSDTNSIFAIFGEQAGNFMDSIKREYAKMSDDQIDSISYFALQPSSMTQGLITPKIILRAPMMLSSNYEEVGYSYVTISNNERGLEFQPGVNYAENLVTEPVRQRFQTKLPNRIATSPFERAQWRQVLRWCESCENAFVQANPRGAGLTFHDLPNNQALVEVSCGLISKQQARVYYLIDARDRMPNITVHGFPVGFYVDDPAFELREGTPHMVKWTNDIVVGKVNLDLRANRLTVDRGTAKETYDLGTGAPTLISAQYKDKAGKWLKFDDYIPGTETFGQQICADGVKLTAPGPIEY